MQAPRFRRVCDVQQGAVSRMERRGDIKVSSLRQYCQSPGGKLRLMAQFRNGSAKVIQLEDEQETARAPGTMQTVCDATCW